MTQSSTEAEYITLLEVAKQKNPHKFYCKKIDDVVTPGYIYGDNEESTFLDNNNQEQKTTNHIDTR